jgi:hypothetical protein
VTIANTTINEIIIIITVVLRMLGVVEAVIMRYLEPKARGVILNNAFN